MTWLLATILCIALVEIVMRVPILPQLKAFQAVGSKAANILRAPRVSDHWKEKVLLAYALALLAHTARLAVYLLILTCCILLFILASNRLGVPLFNFLTGWAGIMYSLCVATTYSLIRRNHA